MAYLYIFESKASTLLFGLAFSLFFTLAMVGIKNAIGYTVRLCLFNYVCLFPVGYFFSLFFSNIYIDYLDLASCFIFELFVLFVIILIFQKIISLKDSLFDFKKIKKTIAFITLFIILMNIPLLLDDSFGISSLSGSRLTYLNNNPLFKYLTYANILIINFLGLLIAANLEITKKIGVYSSAALIVVFLSSVLSGSKGMFFMFVLQIIAVIDYGKYKISALRMFLFIFFFMLLFMISMYYMSSFLSISYEQFINLAFSRFFLANDARALAFDFRNLISDRSVPVFLTESFRSYSSLLGVPPEHPPIGTLLFSFRSGVLTDNGANASISALAVLYSKQGYAILNLLVVIIFPLLLFFASALVLRIDKNSIRVLFFLTSIFCSLVLFSQDFLSFQLVIYVLICIYILWVFLSFIKSSMLKGQNESAYNCNTHI